LWGTHTSDGYLF
jgi:succinyl-CoA synthetase beta subunit